jgi:hypothetical protein
MTQGIYSEQIQQKLELLEPILASVEQGGGEADLQDLQLQLIDLISLAERDPGLEIATTDLYGAAAAMVADSIFNFQPMARKLRLLRDAWRRFRGRVAAARPIEQGSRVAWRDRVLQIAA